MARVPSTFPRELASRDKTERSAPQVGAPVRAIDVNGLEIATSYLAAGRPLAAPCGLGYISVGGSTITLRTRIAAPIVPEYAVVHGMIAADDYITTDIRASSDTTGLTTWETLAGIVVGGGVETAFAFEIVIAIGAGTPASPGFEEVHLGFLNQSASGIVLHSWGVCPLPHVRPYSDGEI